MSKGQSRPNSLVMGRQSRFWKHFYEIPLLNVACMGNNEQSTSYGLAGWIYSYHVLLIFTPCHINEMDHRTLLYLRWLFSRSYYQHMGEGGEVRRAEHSVHQYRTAAVSQMRLVTQIIVSYGAILSFTALFKENSRMASNEPAQRCKRQWINLCTSSAEDIALF
jgi:hypothetical protein